jgi:hypothetical protein
MPIVSGIVHGRTPARRRTDRARLDPPRPSKREDYRTTLLSLDSFKAGTTGSGSHRGLESRSAHRNANEGYTQGTRKADSP